MCATCSAQGSGCWEGDAQVRRDLIATPRCVAESGRSRGNTGRSLHSAFFAKVVLVSSTLALCGALGNAWFSRLAHRQLEWPIEETRVVEEMTLRS
ncbi:hypothetical protein Taro_036870 [Colocasia esculenta]|uniref:Uncharacterized protein n=1 Tax=Colocasia esculenta TaxID=4460 RepID=A0A843WEL4_COLES|nr:hypothetical protein [Colocasia esculenta]